MNPDQLTRALEYRAAVRCREAALRGDALSNPYLPGSDEHSGWEIERHRIENERNAA